MSITSCYYQQVAKRWSLINSNNPCLTGEKVEVKIILKTHYLQYSLYTKQKEKIALLRWQWHAYLHSRPLYRTLFVCDHLVVAHNMNQPTQSKRFDKNFLLQWQVNAKLVLPYFRRLWIQFVHNCLLLDYHTHSKNIHT